MHAEVISRLNSRCITVYVTDGYGCGVMLGNSEGLTNVTWDVYCKRGVDVMYFVLP